MNTLNMMVLGALAIADANRMMSQLKLASYANNILATAHKERNRRNANMIGDYLTGTMTGDICVIILFCMWMAFVFYFIGD